MPSIASSPTSSGITTTSEGDRHIPSSVRPDGSTRKEIKIRPGYRPPEDVEVYKNRTAEAWKTRGQKLGVPGAETVVKEETTKGAGGDRNARRREAKRRAKAADDQKEKPDEADDAAKANEEDSGKVERTGRKHKPDESNEAPDLTVEKEKQVRNLKKKLRQARELSDKKDQGQSLLPEQFEKVIKINELIRQLDNLGFYAEGDLKD